MTLEAAPPPPAPPAGPISVELVRDLRRNDLLELCDAAEAAIEDGGGFGWLIPPPHEAMERYWKGVLLVPERSLFLARLDGTVAGSAQLMRPPRNNEAQSFAGWLTTSFVAPWARNHGLAAALTRAVEAEARRQGCRVLNLDVRETQTRAITLYEHLGFKRWGTHPHYALVGGAYVAGHYYTKEVAAPGGGAGNEGGTQP